MREDNGVKNATYVYVYDKAGNITSIKTYALTAEGATPTTPTSTKTYEYDSDDGWNDKLTSFNDINITYDSIGNPLSYYNGYTYSWTGRQLTGATQGTNTYAFTYNADGIRTSKTKNGETTYYFLNGTQIIGEETNGNITLYIYDESVTYLQQIFYRPRISRAVFLSFCLKNTQSFRLLQQKAIK